MKNRISLFLASGFLLLAVPVIAAQLQSSRLEPSIPPSDPGAITCPTGYSARPHYLWDRHIHEWVFKGWICQPNGGYGP